jgi:hypothetical protein
MAERFLIVGCSLRWSVITWLNFCVDDDRPESWTLLSSEIRYFLLQPSAIDIYRLIPMTHRNLTNIFVGLPPELRQFSLPPKRKTRSRAQNSDDFLLKDSKLNWKTLKVLVWFCLFLLNMNFNDFSVLSLVFTLISFRIFRFFCQFLFNFFIRKPRSW